jgi:hypothetical protein
MVSSRSTLLPRDLLQGYMRVLMPGVELALPVDRGRCSIAWTHMHGRAALSTGAGTSRYIHSQLGLEATLTAQHATSGVCI